MPENVAPTALTGLRRLAHRQRPVTRAEAAAAWQAVTRRARDVAGRPRPDAAHGGPRLQTRPSAPFVAPNTIAPGAPAAPARPDDRAGFVATPDPPRTPPIAANRGPESTATHLLTPAPTEPGDDAGPLPRPPAPPAHPEDPQAADADGPTDGGDLARVVHLRPRDREVPRARYSDAMLLQAIRRVADDLGHVPSRTSYQEAARRLGLPSLPTVANRFGTWTAAVTVAGMTPNTSPGMQARRWTPDVCWRALVNLTADLGEPPTLDQYELLAAGSDDLPSAATVRIRLGLWSDISARLRSADAHPVLGRLGVASDVPAERRDEEILLAYLADDVTDEELARLVRDGLFAWRPAYGEAPEVLACEDR